MNPFGFLYGGPYGWVIGALQIVCVVHALANRREAYWFLVLFFLPGLGTLVYFFMEVLPDLRRGRLKIDTSALQSSGSRLANLKAALAESGTVQNHQALAEEYKRQKMWPEAKETWLAAAQGIHANDPHLHCEIANADFHQGNAQDAKTRLQTVLQDCPMELRGKANILMARLLEKNNLEKDNKPSETERHYRDAISSNMGDEAKVRFAAFLMTQKRNEEANAILNNVLRDYKRASSLYQRQEREWFFMAQQLRNKKP